MYIYIYIYILQSAFCCRSSGGVSSVLVFYPPHDCLLYVRPLLSPCCGLGEGQVAPVYAKVVAHVVFVVKRTGFDPFYLTDPSGLPAGSWVCLGCLWLPLGASGGFLGTSWASPGDLLGTSWLPPGCLLGASWVPPGCFLGASASRCPP